VRRIAALASSLAALLLTMALMAWMTAKVAEHPGVPREVGELPPWFTGAPAMPGAREPSTARAAAGEAAPGHGHEAGTAVASIKPAAPEKTAAAEGEYVDVAGDKVEIAYKEYQLTPNKIRVGPGKVTFVLRNEGRYSHDFRINVEGPGIDITTQKFGPGRTIRLEVALQEGEYKISCPLSNHDERGMHGTLIVTSKLAGK
jgi:uncharacterized cupredoxin-like copper-binding protein